MKELQDAFRVLKDKVASVEANVLGLIRQSAVLAQREDPDAYWYERSGAAKLLSKHFTARDLVPTVKG